MSPTPPSTPGCASDDPGLGGVPGMTLPVDPGLVPPDDHTGLIPTGAAAPSAQAGPPVEEPEAGLSRGKLVLRRFRRRKVSMAALGVIAGLFVIAFVGPYLS